MIIYFLLSNGNEDCSQSDVLLHTSSSGSTVTMSLPEDRLLAHLSAK